MKLPSSQFEYKKNNEDTLLCKKNVIYVINKILILQNGQIIKCNVQIKVDPSNKIISNSSVLPKKKVKTFDTYITSFECNLNENMTAGTAIYKGYTKGSGGIGNSCVITIIAKNGKITITQSDENNNLPRYNMIVKKWEVISN